MKKIIALVLVVVMLFSIGTTAYAAGGEEFLSEVSLVYADSVDEAKKKIKDTDWKLFEKDLNPNADYMFDDGVYLVYKTSTNVEDAITDLRVMDMYGGYNISDYERQLEKSREEYLEMVALIRVAAEEFKSLYDAGDKMAALAYRQMNYYKDSGETNKLMGDFLFDIPSDNDLVRVMMEGNSIVVSNLMSLLAIGISRSNNNAFAARLSKLYAEKDTLSAESYHEDAVILSESFESIRAKILRYDALSEEYDIYDDATTEEEAVFITEYMPLAILLDEIMLGDTSLADVIRKGEWQVADLYPVVAALSRGQMALVSFGQFEVILKYSMPTKPVEELEAALDENEEELKDENGNIVPIDVYIGVDREIFSGAFAMTNAAERQQALTGKTWDLATTASSIAPLYAASLGFFVLDVILWAQFISEYNTAAFLSTQKPVVSHIIYVKTGKDFAKWSVSSSGFFWSALGIGLVALGLSGVGTWYNYYNPDYTEIPNVLVDVKETDLGDKYIKYNAAKVYGEEDKNADFNAYEGKEWIALYYTKDATAGNCLTPNFVYRENNATVSRRHQGISMFGEADAFNLNSHVYNDDAVGVYLTVRYSTQKKAAADLPDVVGSTIGDGAYYALSAFGGFGIGLGLMGFIGRGKKKKNDEALTNEASSEE